MKTLLATLFLASCLATTVANVAAQASQCQTTCYWLGSQQICNTNCY